MSINNRINTIFYPDDWQVPAQTEKHAYESVMVQYSEKAFHYIAFPWATLIDSLNTWSSAKSAKLLLGLAPLRPSSGEAGRVVTVCQHIQFLKYIDLFKVCGITDVFWSHKVKGSDVCEGIRLHPFPLFPAQTFDLSFGEKSIVALEDRKYLANFIGAYNHGLYLSNVRRCIFDDKDKYKNVLIVERNAWHFNRHVYQEQMQGIQAQQAQLAEEAMHKAEYLDAIRQSLFTLCPTGSGPNSIRIFESIELHSIPVIISKDLHLPGPTGLWDKACVIVEDHRDGYEMALKIMREMSMQEIKVKIEHLKELEQYVLPCSYGSLILDNILNKA